MTSSVLWPTGTDGPDVVVIYESDLLRVVEKRTYTSVLVRWGGSVVGEAVSLVESGSVLNVVQDLVISFCLLM